MRIAITGVSGTGKTTLVKAMASQLSLPFLGEDLQTIVAAGKRINSISNDQALLQDAINHYQRVSEAWLAKRHEFQRSNDSFITDRCCFDILARWINLLKTFGEDDQRLLQVIQECRRQSADLDLIVVLPIGPWTLKASKNDEGLARDPRLSHKISHQALTIGLMQQFSKAPQLYLSLKETSTASRIDKILASLRRLSLKQPQLDRGSAGT